jgi:hypothetical protein
MGSEMRGKVDEDRSIELEQRLSGDLADLRDFAQEFAKVSSRSRAESSVGEPLTGGNGRTGTGSLFPERINADEESVEQGLAKLVLALIDVVRQLLEKQAMHRIDAGSLSDDEIERMGETFLKLEQKMTELKASFGLEGEDLSLNIGPLGDLLSDS